MTARLIERALSAFANPERAAVMSGGYSPSRLRYVGASVPEMRSIVRTASAALKDQPPRAVIQLALALVGGGIAEARQVGWELIARRKDAMALLTPRLVERLGRGNDNWASVDGFSVYLAGVAWRDGRVRDVDVRRWSRSKNRWWRRTALVSTVPLNIAARGGTGDARRTLVISATAVTDRDPMIVKALSWALRTLIPRDPTAVRDFLQTHRADLATLVIREVTAKLDTGTKASKHRR